MTDLSDLISRVRKAEGPDRQLDYALFCYFAPMEVASAWHPLNGHKYTSSIDDALALLERVLRPEHPGMTMYLRSTWSGRDDHGWCRTEITWPSHEFIGHASSAPMAIIEALLLSLQEIKK